jgi:hypothetical protein
VSTPEAENIPSIIGGLRVLLCSRIDERHQQAGVGWQSLIEGNVKVRGWGVAICESADGDGFRLLTCEDDWTPVAHTRHPTLEEAKRQAEFEYEGLESTWQTPPS